MGRAPHGATDHGQRQHDRGREAIELRRSGRNEGLIESRLITITCRSNAMENVSLRSIGHQSSASRAGRSSEGDASAAPRVELQGRVISAGERNVNRLQLKRTEAAEAIREMID